MPSTSFKSYHYKIRESPAAEARQAIVEINGCETPPIILQELSMVLAAHLLVCVSSSYKPCLADSQKRHDENLLGDRELEQARAAVMEAELNVGAVRRQLAEADQQIAQTLIDAETRKQREEYVREHPHELIGPKPAQSANGTMPIVIKWFNDHLNDPYTAHYVSWTKVRKGFHDGKAYWIVGVRMRAKNAFNAYRLSDYTFYIRHNRIVIFDSGD